MAKLLNPEGFVKIGNELINFIDITTPEDLIALRLLAPSDAVTFSVDHNTIFENNIPQQSNGKRRFWLNTHAGNFVWIEACFRKKISLWKMEKL